MVKILSNFVTFLENTNFVIKSNSGFDLYGLLFLETIPVEPVVQNVL